MISRIRHSAGINSNHAPQDLRNHIPKSKNPRSDPRLTLINLPPEFVTLINLDNSQRRLCFFYLCRTKNKQRNMKKIILSICLLVLVAGSFAQQKPVLTAKQKATEDTIQYSLGVYMMQQFFAKTGFVVNDPVLF